MVKIRTKCKKEKTTNSFYMDKNRVDGYFPWCKGCVSIGTKKYRENNKEKVTEAKKQHRKKNGVYYAAYAKQYNVDNDTLIKKQREGYRLTHKEEKANYDKEYYVKTKEAQLLYQKEYTKKNKEKIKIRRRKYTLNNLAKKSTKNAEYRAKQLQRLPTWANLAAIKEVYNDCVEINLAAKTAGCTEKFVVDHICPLQGKIVSGLHIAANLQIITNSENCRKNNKFEPVYT